MNFRRSFSAIAALWLLLIPAQAAEQASYVWPVAPVTGGAGANGLGSLTANYYNPALRALASCNFGATAPANGPSGAPLVGQCWMDTSASPSFALRYWDGAAWATLATLDSTSHAWVIASGSVTRNVAGTSDSFVDGDRGKMVDVCNAAGVAHSLPQAGTGGAFVAGWFVTVRVPLTCAGNDIITPTTSTIDAAPALTLRPGQSIVIRSDGANYKTTLLQQPWNANLAGIAGLTTAADKCEYWTGAGTPALMDCLSWARAVISAASASAGRSAFGLAIGSDVQAYSANLSAMAGLTGAAGKVPYFTGPAALAMFDSTSFGRSVSNVADAAALRALAGSVIGTNVQAWDADLDCIGAISTTGLISRTGAGTCAVRSIVGTANQITVTNGDGVAGAPTISIPSSAALPGAPTTTTAAAGDNSAKIATTSYADSSSAAAAAPKANSSRNIATGCGLAGGGDLSADRTIRLSLTVNSQTGASYTVLDGDCGKVVRLTNASSVAVSLPQPNGSTFVSGWSVDFQNTGVGAVTITPVTSTINGNANLVLTTGQGGHCDSDGSNYTCVLGVGAGGGGGVTSIVCNGVTITGSGTCPGTMEPANCALAASVASNLLSAAVKDYSGADASASSPCRIPFRNATAATGTPSVNNVTSALSVSTFAVGASLGAQSGKAFRLYVVAFDNAGTTVLSLFNAVSITAGGQARCYPINESAVQNSVAMTSGANSAGVFYTPNGTTLTGKAIKILGMLEYNATGLTTAGTYATAPNFIDIMAPGFKKPCERVQSNWIASSSPTSTSSTSYSATAVNTSIEVTSAADIVTVAASGPIFGNAATTSANMFIFKGANACTTVTTAGGQIYSAAGAASGHVNANWQEAPNVLGNVAYTACVSGGPGTSTFPYAATGGNGMMTIEQIRG